MFRRIILFYQRWISPLLPPRCRYLPTCSSYALEALDTHGTLRGTCLAVKRICRCHPFSAGGYDPVPVSMRQYTRPADRGEHDAADEQSKQSLQ